MTRTPPPSPDDTRLAQDNAVRQFRAWAENPYLLALDTETTGLEGAVWEFAAVRVSDQTAPLVFTCTPTGEWSQKAREMHSARMTAIYSAPPAEAFTRALAGVLAHTVQVAYNAPFDRAALARTWPDLEMPEISCAQQAYAPLAGKWSSSRGEWKYVSLEAACEAERVDLRGLPEAHSAHGDALRLALLIRQVAERETHSEREDREDHEAAAQYHDARGDRLT